MAWRHITIWKRDIMDKVLTLTYPINDWSKIKKAMTLEQACKECGITSMTLHNWMRADQSLRRIWDEAQSTRKEVMTMKSKENIFKAIEWEMGLRKKDVVDVSFRYLEKTSKEFQPTAQIEMKSMNMNFEMTLDEINEKIKSLQNN